MNDDRAVNQFLREMKRQQQRAVEIPHTVFLVMPLTSTAWNGDDTKTVDTYTIDTSAMGAPAGIRACTVFLQGIWAAAAAGSSALVRAVGGITVGAIYATVAGMPQATQVRVACDQYGDFEIQVVGASLTSAYMRISDYTL
jgi:hypothetical protein